MAITLESELVCPVCGHKSVEMMPEDACLYFYQCEGCSAMLKPQAGDCCVFCSYGSIACPPVQAAGQAGEKERCCP